MFKINFKKRVKVFTLVEFLISLSIISVIASLSAGSFRSLSRIYDLNKEQEETLRDIRWFLDRLDMELCGTIYVRRMDQTLFVSRRKEIGSVETSDLSFTTVMPQDYLEIGRRGEVVKVEYIISMGVGEKNKLCLTKKLYFNIYSSEEKPQEYMIGEDFSSFMMRFLSQGKWYEKWDTDEMDRLPDGVELIFTVGEKRFKTYFNLFISET